LYRLTCHTVIGLSTTEPDDAPPSRSGP